MNKEKYSTLKKLVLTQDWFFMLKEDSEYERGLNTFLEFHKLYYEIKDTFTVIEIVSLRLLQIHACKKQPEFNDKVIEVYDF